ncbi:hypothetical protein [Massilia putida]|uniref:hypothetical protein n=1 Tax=Massilia putida TaxID=1141883 RepID=UPI0009535504|nr:hypothetical protein [Massilia putida]
MRFFQQYARFIVPMPSLFLAALKSWEVMHGGDKAQLLACVGWFGAALLFYAGQKHIYDERRKKAAD